MIDDRLPPTYLSADEVRAGIERLEQDMSGGQRILDCSATLKRLEGDSELFQDLLGFFYADAPQHVAGIRAAIRSGDAAALRRSAHALKGLVSNFNAWPTIERAAELEQLGTDGDLAEAAKVVPLLDQEFDRLRRALAEHFPSQ